MEIHINGDAREVADRITAAQLIEGLGLGKNRLAVEINCEILPRSSFTSHQLNPGDRVEIVHAIGGG